MYTCSVDPAVLDKSPDALIALSHGESDKVVAVSEHPDYQKYFKMVRIGISVEDVKKKMSLDGFDPSILDKALNEKVQCYVCMYICMLLWIQYSDRCLKLFLCTTTATTTTTTITTTITAATTTTTTTTIFCCR